MTFPLAAKISLSILVAILLVVGAYLFSMSAFPGQRQNSSSSTASSTTQTSPTLHTADYTQPIAFDSTVTPEIKAQLNKQLADLQDEIKKNPLDVRSWLNLGTVYKVGGDYVHAAVAWNYLVETVPSLSAPYSNLGDLYMNFLKDYPKAEVSYKKVIELQPHAISAYHDLYYLYEDFLKDSVKAKAVLKAGLEKNPSDPDLSSLLDEYNKKHVQ